MIQQENEKRRCRYCFKVYEGKRADARYCSSTCRSKHCHERKDRAEIIKMMLEAQEEQRRRELEEAKVMMNKVLIPLLESLFPPKKKVPLHKRIWRRIFFRRRHSISLR